MKKLICILVGTLYLAGCTTMNDVPYSRGTFEKDAVRVGDQIALTTSISDQVALAASVREYRFEVASVASEQICGKDKCVRADEIESIQRKEFSWHKTTGFVVVIALIGGAVASVHGGFLAGGLNISGPLF